MQPTAALVAMTVAAITLAATSSSTLSPFGLPAGSTVRYRVTAQSSQPGNKTQAATRTIALRHLAESSVRVLVNGKNMGNVGVSGDGSADVPDSLQTTLAPLMQVATFVKAAPSPLASDDTWTAMLPVPLGTQTDNVSITLKATQLVQGAGTIAGTGSNTFNVQMANGTFPADVTVNVTIGYGTAHTLTSASCTFSAVVHQQRDRRYGGSWTITPL
ncbi:MAG: hypothetical protein JO029_03575 [Candidatus Eremiobacteraeota bacterium]|nr:hypothetical protein [Candidatus Eremiobacteraeota bacterium]MBV8582720.1 hypothetical protein [Candidatus Eremiobacteraeota bacterium]